MKRSESYFDSPHSKRPKLDYGVPSKSYPLGSARLMTEWDDDLSGDQLEEVCIIAELTQAPRISNTKQVDTHNDVDNRLAAENTRLKDSIKVKEGEIGILRSQLKQNQTSKQNDALNNLRTIDKLEEKHKLSVESLKKQVEQLQSEIEFKNLEVTDLSERCKQLEVKSPRVNFVHPSAVLVEEKKNLFSLSQAISSKSKNYSKIDCDDFKPYLTSEAFKKHHVLSEGEKLARHLDSSFFRQCDEPSVITMFSSNTCYGESLDHAKSEKYRWTGLPVVPSKIKCLEPFIVELFQSNSFPVTILQNIYEITNETLKSFINLLKFLNNLPMNIEADKILLDDTDPGKNWTLADVLSNKLLRPVEKGVEIRRVLGAVCCIVLSSDKGLEIFEVLAFIEVLSEIAELINKLMRPLEFCGMSLAILFFLQILLERRCIDKANACKSTLNLSKNIISNIILSRPKLDVLREAIHALAAGSFCKELSSELCRKSPMESSALYMDSKLQQAMFFNHEACPLKLLQLQVRTLAHLCNSTTALVAITNSFITWFHSLLANSLKPQLWLFPDNEKCCNILECFCYLLTLLIPNCQKEQKCKNTFEKGILTLRNCCKGHKKKLKQTTLKLLPSTLRGSNVLEFLSFKAREAALFVITEYESDVITQETAAHTLNCSDS